jgi:hypothetical protein
MGQCVYIWHLALYRGLVSTSTFVGFNLDWVVSCQGPVEEDAFGQRQTYEILGLG